MSDKSKLTQYIAENLAARRQYKEAITSGKISQPTQAERDQIQRNTQANWYQNAGVTRSTHGRVLLTIASLKDFIRSYYIGLLPLSSADQNHPPLAMRSEDRYCGYQRVNAVYQKALTENTLVTPHTEDNFWLSMSLTNGDCGVFAIALHLALKVQGIDSDILIDTGNNHAAVKVHGRVYDAINYASINSTSEINGVLFGCSVEEGSHLEWAYTVEHLVPACARWIPFDNIGWGIINYFQQCYTKEPVELKVPCEATTPLDALDLKNIGQVASSLVTKYKAV